MTYFIGLPDQPATKSFEDLDKAISTCKWWRHIYSMSDYRVTDSDGTVVFPTHIKNKHYGSFGMFLYRHEDYEE